MKLQFLAVFMLLTSLGFSQERGNKGKAYAFWGYNRAWFSHSDISFSGDNYNFLLENVHAKDRQSDICIKYLKPDNLTLPQTNIRLGYFIDDHFSIGLNVDHMKYVVQPEQTVLMSGNINTGGPFDGSYQKTDRVISEDFLKFEHTDGLNYINTEIKYHGKIANIIPGKISLEGFAGSGLGVMFPKTNSTLMGGERADKFHVAGGGVHLTTGLNLIFFEHLTLQAEVKSGYIRMWDILTTNNDSDRAQQSILFVEPVYLIGYQFYLKK